MAVATGQCNPPSFSLAYAFLTVNDHLESHSQRGQPLVPTTIGKASGRIANMSSIWGKRVSWNCQGTLMSDPSLVQWSIIGPEGSKATRCNSGKSILNWAIEHHLSTQNLVPLPFLTSIAEARKRVSFTVETPFQKEDAQALFLHLSTHQPVKGR